MRAKVCKEIFEGNIRRFSKTTKIFIWFVQTHSVQTFQQKKLSTKGIIWFIIIRGLHDMFSNHQNELFFFNKILSIMKELYDIIDLNLVIKRLSFQFDYNIKINISAFSCFHYSCQRINCRLLKYGFLSAAVLLPSKIKQLKTFPEPISRFIIIYKVQSFCMKLKISINA